MPSLRDCLGQAGKLLHHKDGEQLFAKARQYMMDGHPVKDAERMAVDSHLRDAHATIDDIYKQAGVERNAKPPEKPEPAIESFGEPKKSENPFDTSATSQRLTELRNNRPRPIEKLYGSNGPTPEQRVAHEAKIREWNKDYRKAVSEHKDMVDKSNDFIASRASESKPTSQKIIDALEKLKVDTTPKGKLTSGIDPIDAYKAARNMALDAAIIGVKAGRELVHMIELATKRFKAAYPKATPEQVAKLKSDIESAHAEANGKDTAQKATPEQRAETKANEVISSPKAEETRSKIGKWWNDVQQGADIKKTLAETNDAAENQAHATARESRTTLDDQLQRDLGKDEFKKNTGLIGDALGFHVEAGKDGRAELDSMRKQIEASTKADPKIKARAIDAIDYAKKNYDKLKPAADLYRALTKTQLEREQGVGMPTMERSDYVPHQQDLEEGNWLDKLTKSGNGMASTGASNRKNRTFDTHADSISAGFKPKSLNALDLLQNRISSGETGVNLRQWQQSLHNYIDPKTKAPIAMKATRVERPDGSAYYQAPKGYSVEMLGNTPLAVHDGYKGVVSALTDPSWWSKTENRVLAQKINAGAKSFSLLIDTFHLGRLAINQSILKSASLADFKLPIPSFKEGLGVLDHSPAEMKKMAAAGEIDRKALPELLRKKENLQLLTKNGLNVGHVGDAMHQELVRKIPGIGDINKFIFEKFQRGAMTESALMEFDRQSKSYKDLSPDQVARQVARDINTKFGNIGKQGWFKSKTSQDLVRMIALAPQWNEGLIKSEAGGLHQIGKSIVDAATGKRFAMGALGRQMIAGAVGIFAANQIINQMTRGKFTWENPEEGAGAKISAWIPDVGGKNSSGFFLNPMGIMAEVSHTLLSKFEKNPDATAAIVDYLRGRASTTARPLIALATGTDSLGHKAPRVSTALKEAVPVPIGAGAVGSFAKGVVKGGNTETFPGQFQKQAMQSFGVKTDSAASPEQRMYHLADEYNRAHNVTKNAEFNESPYRDLNAALVRKNQNDIKDELQSLLQTQTHAQIEKHFKNMGKHPFTQSKKSETDFVRTLNQEQRQTYLKAQRDRLERGQAAIRALSQLPNRDLRTGTD